MLKLAIANDTEIAIESLRRAIAPIPDYQLLWVARTGIEAVQFTARQRPDLILMDMNMPDLNGVAATQQIMRQSPCAILIVTASITRNTTLVFEAMGYGALDVVKTPGPGDVQALLHKIKTVAKLVQPTQPQITNPPLAPRVAALQQRLPPLIVIGASTGGPRALYQILSQLPSSLNAAIVIVQHIDEQFAAGLAHWLGGGSLLPVRLVHNGDRPTPGQVLIASTNDHLILRPNQSLRYTREPADAVYRPSVDVFFQTVAQHWPQAGTAVLLTGMGRDGAQGMKQLRTFGWQTIAQNQESCVVFGMPKAAIEQGGASEVLPLEQIASRIRLTNRLQNSSQNSH
ncbi:MAG: chemotaxis response regulator protein-glutamate methylesterase [Spirulinaceae cyanobacterium]